MDLIYTDVYRIDKGVLKDYLLDLAFGDDENDFSITVDINNEELAIGNYIYFQDTEYGGLIDTINVDTDLEQIIYSGKTWQGLLESKIIEPDGDYLTLTGEANELLGDLITLLDLDDLFSASSVVSGVEFTSYEMDRYIGGYSGIVKMLKTMDLKLTFVFVNNKVELQAEAIVDYSQDDEFDSSQIDFDITKYYTPTNHLICLGSGDLGDQQVINLYADADGNISTTQTYTGLDERVEVYENKTVESLAILTTEGTEQLEALWSVDEININFENNENSYDIGDIVGARENITGLFISQEIVKKIISIKAGIITISYEV